MEVGLGGSQPQPAAASTPHTTRALQVQRIGSSPRMGSAEAPEPLPLVCQRISLSPQPNPAGAVAVASKYAEDWLQPSHGVSRSASAVASRVSEDEPVAAAVPAGAVAVASKSRACVCVGWGSGSHSHCYSLPEPCSGQTAGRTLETRSQWRGNGH